MIAGEVKKEQLFFSESLGPMAQHCIGRWFKDCEESEPDNLYHACHTFWYGVRALDKLAIACNNSRERDGAVHFSIAMGNELRRVSAYIESKIGVDPLSDKSGEWS
jgi:hypothetical protein